MALPVSPATRHQLTLLLTAFSLGTLCFIRRWYDLEHLQPPGLDYFRATPADSTLLISTMIASLILAAGFRLAWFWVERHPTPGRRKFAHCVFMLVLIFPLESVRRYWITQTDKFDLGSNLSLALIESILAAGLVAVLLGNSRVLRPARRVTVLLTLLFPALMLDFEMNRLGAEPAGRFAPRTPLPMLPSRGPHAPRFIWLLFDEMDQRLAFERRPASLELPELDRLRAESVIASHATQTAMYTAIALPSLLSGRVFTNAQALDVNTLMVTAEGSKERGPWRSESNVFQGARELGVNAELAGWLHPYCRILGDQVTGCLSIPSSHSTAALAEELHATRQGIWKTVINLYERQFRNLADMLDSFGDPSSDRARDQQVQKDQQLQYFQVRDWAYQAAVDPQVGLIFVHFPTPHPFPIYNRREHSFNLRGSEDYFDNLALVDRTVGELRGALEQAGLWDQTSILITSDHGFRPGGWAGHLGWTEELDRLTGHQAPLTVPFIVKLPGQHLGTVIDRAFSNVLSADLGLAVLSGAVATPDQAVAWLEQHAATTSKPDPAAITSVKPNLTPVN
jgi:hypothetical protein